MQQTRTIVRSHLKLNARMNTFAADYIYECVTPLSTSDENKSARDYTLTVIIIVERYECRVPGFFFFYYFSFRCATVIAYGCGSWMHRCVRHVQRRYVRLRRIRRRAISLS